MSGPTGRRGPPPVWLRLGFAPTWGAIARTDRDLRRYGSVTPASTTGPIV
jgi:hypothetical protein